MFDFAPKADIRREPVFWTFEVFPRVLHLAMTKKALWPSSSIPIARLPDADCRLVGNDLHICWQPENYPHRLIVVNECGEACFNTVQLPVDEAFDTRLHAAGRFWRQLNGRASGPDYGALPPHSRRLAILTLRIFDGRKAGATYREIANTLLVNEIIQSRDWRDHPLKHRIREFLRKADRMIYDGGYHDLLFYPHRRGKPRGGRIIRG
ncbi:hypothetical protein ATN84_06840 [Paramesorhizobium deserti]|uniref:T6SS Transcription factor RovC-like DNA binding domain-containing protein n=1 Tax=Paramesorhizobium deserti TaxID=1494590 RepID=A0A135I1U2_9HYPH|nr:DUF2285 domain-containing protein [Paramesorhizobium deserti]KXF79412.1 hypothetical protein ATN84_06840 [Paramesorhizobium deserti]